MTNEPRIRPENVNRAIELIWKVLELGIMPPMVAPIGNGGLQLEWHTKAGHIEVYIEHPDRPWAYVRHKDPDVKSTGTTLEESVKEWLQYLAKEADRQ